MEIKDRLSELFEYFNLIPTREIKKERIKYACENIENILYTFTEDNIKSGYIVMIFHYIYFLTGLFYIWFIEINYNFFIQMIVPMIIHYTSFFYYGGTGCIITRIERHLFNSKEWFGPLTPLKYIYDFELNKDNIDFILLIIWLPSFIFLIYKIYIWL